MSKKYLFDPTEHRMQSLKSLSQQADLSVAELLRRMIDHCTSPKVVNEFFPTLSGQIHLDTKV